MEDIAPKLLVAIRKDFLEILDDAKVEQLNYLGAEDYAEKVGAALAEAFRRNIRADMLPEGRLFWNIADRVIRPMLEKDHKLVADAAQNVQQTLNKAAGLGLKAQRSPLDQDKVSGILNKVATAEDFDAVAWVLDEPVKTFSRSVVDDTLQRNIEFQGKAGLKPRVIRTAESHCCEWCSRLGGVYAYPDVPKDVYQRHERCRCSVEYDPGNGKRRQNVHTKKWTAPEENAKIKARKLIGLKSHGLQIQEISEHIVERISERNVEVESILDAFMNPLDIKPVKYDLEGRPSVVLVGEKATIAINPETGRLATTYPTHSKLAAKLKKKKEEKES